MLAEEPRHVEALYRLGLVCQRQDRLVECVELYQQCLQVKPDFAVVHNNLGTALAALGHQKEAIASYQEAVRLQPDYAVAWTHLGLLQTAQGDLDDALESCKRAVALEPDNPEAQSNLGIVHFQQHRVEESVRCFQEALALRPQFPEALMNLGYTLLYQGRLGDAADCFRQSLQLWPNDTRSLNHLAGIFRLQQQWAEAEALLRQSLAVHATNWRTYRELATLYHEQGKSAEARECYERVLLLSPADAESRFLADALGDNPPAQLPAEQLTAMFDAYAVSFDQDLVNRLNYLGPDLLRSALEPAPEKPSLAVLDLGCGTGLCGLQFRAWASTLVGVDLAPKMLAKARERGIYDELILSELVPALKDRRDQFDLVVAGDVFIYIGELGPLFQAVAQALRPGGRFAFTVEHLEGAGYQVLPTGRFAHSREYLRQLARACNLQESMMHAAAIRRQAGQDVPGLVVVLTR